MRRFAFSRLMSIVVFVPLVGLALFGGILSYNSWSRYSELSGASSVLRVAVATARFVGIAIPGEGGLNRDVIAGTGDRAQRGPRGVVRVLRRLSPWPCPSS